MGELLNIDFHFLGLNLAQTPSITDPGFIWIIPDVYKRQPYIPVLSGRRPHPLETAGPRPRSGPHISPRSDVYKRQVFATPPFRLIMEIIFIGQTSLFYFSRSTAGFYVRRRFRRGAS